MTAAAEQPEALRLANALAYCDSSVASQAAAELSRQHARIVDLEQQMAAIGAGGVEPLRQRQCLHQISEPARWPKDAKEVREFFGSDFIRAEFVADDHEPCDEDRYYISAHDFLSAVNWWADFPHHHPSPSDQPQHQISEPSGWRPIETAPKNSGYVLLRGKREQSVASGYWLQSAYAGNGAWIWPFVHMNPILWMPLPSPSSADEGGSNG